MDVIESIKRDKAYIKCKLLVKNWEKDFKTKCSRTPSKFDIKEAPAKVRYAYKKYFHLKSAALDSTLSVCDFEDDLTCSPDPVPRSESFIPDTLSPDSEQFMQTLPSGSELEELLISAKHKESKPNIIKNITKPLSPFSNNLSKKLFESRKFSIRNPRKSSLQKSQPSRENSEDQENTSLNDVTVEDVSCSLFSFDKEKPSVNPITNSSALQPSGSFINTFDNVSVRHINEAWLERATGATTQDKVVPQHLTTKTVIKESFGIRNIITPVTEKQCDYVENSESDTDDPVINKLKPALKKRKISELLVQEKKENGSSITIMTEEPNQQESDEKPRKRKSKITKKIVHQEDMQKPDITEFLPFGLEDNVTPRHTNVTSVLNNVKSSQLKKTQDIATPEDKLDEKIKKGTLNENFVRINIEKKVFVRGKKSMNYSKYKKKLNKDKKALHAGMEFPESGKISCFKCGGGGHMARYCTAHKGDTLMPLSDCNVEDDIPTLEEMENMICLKNKNFDQSNTEQLMETLYKPSVIPDTFLNALASNSVQNENNTQVKPIYTEQCDPSEELEKVLNLFGHNSFRSGQEQAITRILNGKSTLLVLSTGGGKSLCYQIPAYIYSQHYKCITLVISPLVSLMEDQVLSMPDFLRAGCLHTNQPPTQRQKIMQYIKDGELNILLISPEALVSGDVAGFAGLFKSLPPIAFACIDEAHCVSQWSHNFRPSYLMICRVLREKLNVNCILGLTATASQSTIKSVIDHINIPDGFNGVITNPTLPDNLSLSVSFAKDKDRALISLLASETIEKYNSIIVYCIRRDECTRVAAVLRSTLQEPGKQNMEAQSKKRKRMSYIAEAYHAGMSAAQRKKIQKHFMDGVLRIIVATVAFGMGINKSDIRCIIHYNMPSSFESYVQEVGRAGRDGKPAHCHVFMSNNNNDKNELLKHIHANTIDRPTIRKLIQKIFIQCECNKKNPANNAITSSAQHVRCPGHEVGIPIDLTVEELDMSSENISTLLCYLELHPKKYVKVLNNAYTLCKIISYGGAAKILTAAKTNQALAMAYLMESKKNPDVMKSNILEFPVIEVAAAIGKDSGMVKYQLKNLEWLTEFGTSKRSALKVEFNTLGFRIKAPGDLSSTELDEMLDDLHNSVLRQEKTMLYQLEEINKAFQKLGKHSSDNQQDADFLKEKSQELKLTIRNYFEREDPCNNEIILEMRPLDEERVISDVRALIITYKDCSFTGRSIARIFQGISSPNYPALVWGRCKFWRTHIHEDFYGLIRIATQQIIQMK